VLGDVKGCGPRHKDFPEEEIGEILDMGKGILNKEQFTRTTLICFLTDGYRFQFFRCTRSERGSNISFEQSAVYGGESGWKVFC
jgi:trehalose-6-phosphate synthase